MKSILLIFDDSEYKKLKKVKEEFEKEIKAKTTWKKLINAKVI